MKNNEYYSDDHQQNRTARMTRGQKQNKNTTTIHYRKNKEKKRTNLKKFETKV